MNALVVGDLHLQVNRLEDNQKLLDGLISLSDSHDLVILLGDVNHTFSIVRSEILSQMTYFFNNVKCPVICLVGNHDYAGQMGGTHALEPFKSKTTTIVEDWVVIDGIYYAPFMRDDRLFGTKCSAIPAGSLLFCHQSFFGARFSNGFEDPHGSDPKCCEHIQVISGHIHSSQTVGTVFYPGTPYQQNFGEAGEEKKVYSIEISPKGYEIKKAHDLGLPKFVILEAESLESIKLTEPDPKSFYKIVSKGTPAEISAFWADPNAKSFREKARRVVDAIVADRGEVVIPGSKAGTKSEKLEDYIRSQKWKTEPDALVAAAKTLLSW